MRSLRYLSDLKACTSYTSQFVNQYDANCSAGGGFFKWIQTSNTGVQEIYGYRIIPTTTTLGYWERVSDNPWSIQWFGVINNPGQGTLGSYGFTTAQLNARYNIGGSNTVTTSDTYDTAAIKFLFNLMELGYTFSVTFERKEYYLTSTCNLPRRFSSTSEREYELFQIEGNSAQMRVHSSQAATAFDMWSRVINNQGDALIQIGTLFILRNMLFRGAPSCAQKGLHLKATYNSELSNLTFADLDVGLHLRFCLSATVSRCMAIGIVNEAINVDTGDPIVPGGWPAGPGAPAINNNSYASATSQSNSVEIFKFRHFCQYNTATSIKVTGCSGVVINQPIIEGGQQSRGIWFDSKGVSAVKDLTIFRAHIETTFVNEAIFLQSGHNSQIVVDGVFSQYNCVLVHCDSNTYSSYNTVLVRNINYITPATTFRSPGTNTQWVFEYARSFDPLDPTNWTGTMPTVGVWSATPNTSSTARLFEVYPLYVR
jgi:hypothetical protein